MTDRPEKIGRFTVVDTLGVGGMGIVYRATDPDIGRKVAIKLLHSYGHSNELERFRHEARTIGGLSHPNIVMLLEYGVDADRPFLVMEYLEGTPLARWIRGVHSLAEHKEILLGLCDALEFAHRNQILHRDIKPGNVQVLTSGQAKLLDFGIARSHDSGLTMSGMVVGTPKYLAPEILDDHEHSPSSDCYSLGLLAYNMLSGENPFSASSHNAVIKKQVTVTPRSLHERNPLIPLPLSRTIDAYLQKDPAKRPNTPELLRETLKKITDPKQLEVWIVRSAANVGEDLPPTLVTASKKSASNWLWGAALGLLAVLAGALLIRFSMQSSKPEAEPSDDPHLVSESQPIPEDSGSDVKPSLPPDTPPSIPDTTAPEPHAAGVEEVPSLVAPSSEPEVPVVPVPNEGTPPEIEPMPALGSTQAPETTVPGSMLPITEALPEIPAPEVPAENPGPAEPQGDDHPDEPPPPAPATPPEPVAPLVPPDVKEIPAEPEPPPAPPRVVKPIPRPVEPPPVVIPTLPSLQMEGPKLAIAAEGSTQLSRGKPHRLLINKPVGVVLDRFEAKRGKAIFPGLKILEIREQGPTEIQLTLFVDQDAPLGQFSLTAFRGHDASNSILIEVSL